MDMQVNVNMRTKKYLILSALNPYIYGNFISEFINNIIDKDKTKNIKQDNITVPGYIILNHYGKNNDVTRDTKPDNNAVRYMIDINEFIGLVAPVTTPRLTLTTMNFYRNYIAYLCKTAARSRKLIENMFYLDPQNVLFLEVYMFSLVKLITKYEIKEIICIDPVFLHLYNEFNAIKQSDILHEFIGSKLTIYAMPNEYPIQIPRNYNGKLQLPVLYISVANVNLVCHLPILKCLGNDMYANVDIINNCQLCDMIGYIYPTDVLDVPKLLNDVITPLLVYRVSRANINPDKCIQIIIKPRAIILPPKTVNELMDEYTPDLLKQKTDELTTAIMNMYDLDTLGMSLELLLLKNMKIPVKILYNIP